MKKIGITGGIGAGKSIVCQIFEVLGIPVFYADQEAKWIMENDPEVMISIKVLLGSEAYTKSGHLNRMWISNQVFTKPEMLDQLQQIVHPEVHKRFEHWTIGQDHEKPYVLEEAALLVENKIYLNLDALIVVTCPEEIRIQRVMKRDNLSRAQVLQKINRQLPEEQKSAVADYMIVNDGITSLTNQVLEVHRKICNKSRY